MTKKGDLAFANMDGVKKLELFSPAYAIERVREILWPGGDKDHEWSPDTLDELAMALVQMGYGPKEKSDAG